MDILEMVRNCVDAVGLVLICGLIYKYSKVVSTVEANQKELNALKTKIDEKQVFATLEHHDQEIKEIKVETKEQWQQVNNKLDKICDLMNKNHTDILLVAQKHGVKLGENE